MRLLRSLAPVVCVLAVAVTRPDPFAALSGGVERTLHRSLGDDHIICRLYLDPHDKFTRVSAPRRAAVSLDDPIQASAIQSNITVNYTGFSGTNGTAARSAFQAAVDLWRTQVASTVPIVIDAEFLDICAANGMPQNCGLLGTAGSSALRDAPENPIPGTWYPFPLLNKIAGIDVGVKYFQNQPGLSNIGAEFDSVRSNWYFGTDGNTPSGTVDFMSVVLHEIGHGLGFSGAASVSGGNGTIGSGGFPYIYDRSVVDKDGVSLVNGYTNGSAALGTALTSGGNAGSQTAGTFWSGANAKSANGEVAPKLYAPSSFLQGSSHSHLDDVKYPAGNINSLMTPSLGQAESIHTPGPIALGMFADMGWGANTGPSCSFGLDRNSATVPSAGGTVRVTVSAGSGCAWTVSVGTATFATPSPGSGTGSQLITLTIAANNNVSARSGSITIGTETLTIFQNGTGPTMTLDKSSLIFTAVNNGAQFTGQTPSQVIRMVQAGAGTVSWTATSNQPWLLVAKGSDTPSTTASGTGSATFTIAVQFASNLQSTQTGSITLTLTGAGNFAGPITVTLNTLIAGQATAPFGSFDTPVDQSTGITGSIAVTGWAMDDVGVTGVQLWRVGLPEEGGGPVFIGNATIVDGARPDIAGIYPNLPQNTRAGWGYLMLTNFLPNLGNGTFTLYAIAQDAEGNITSLGTKTITCANASAEGPFGAIDTPVQGGTASGTVNNFGWVLSPRPHRADPPGGGTVRIAIDGALIATVPGGWTSRSDLSALFPVAQFPGINTALGVAALDTTSLTNGVHTIAWVVTANNTRAAGVGSRYFTVSNGSLYLDPDHAAGGANVVSTPAILQMPRAAALRANGSVASLASEVAAAPLDARAITGRRGYDTSTPFRRYTSATGVITVQSEELDRIELRLGGGHTLTGYMRSGSTLAALPIGSALNANTGVFTWQPGVGFVGSYDLTFVRWAGGRAVSRQDVRVVLNPAGSNRVGPQVVIDLPARHDRDVDAQSFVVAGWAADLDSSVDGGVDTVHVWAYPRAGGDPIFIGPAAFGGSRPDVAAVYGERFGKSGYGIEVKGLPRGEYDIAVFAYSTVADGFVPAKTVTIRMR